MILSPTSILLFFACMWTVLAAIVAAVDLIEARARKRRLARRRRAQRLRAYSIRDGRQPYPDNVVELHQHSVKVGDAA